MFLREMNMDTWEEVIFIHLILLIFIKTKTFAFKHLNVKRGNLILLRLFSEEKFAIDAVFYSNFFGSKNILPCLPAELFFSSVSTKSVPKTWLTTKQISQCMCQNNVIHAWVQYQKQRSGDVSKAILN